MARGTKQVGYTNYPNNIGTIAANNGNILDGPAYIMGAQLLPTGVQGGTVTMSSITDGTSNTVMFSEWVKGRADQSTTTGLALHQIFSATIAYPTGNNTFVSPTVYSQACQASTKLTAATSENSKGLIWCNYKCGHGGGYSHLSTPNLKACMFSSDSDATQGHTIVGASSYHPGGVNVTMIDGSVKFIKNSIAPPDLVGPGDQGRRRDHQLRQPLNLPRSRPIALGSGRSRKPSPALLPAGLDERPGPPRPPREGRPHADRPGHPAAVV